MKTENGIALFCGNYSDVLNDVKANLIITSPPYNIGSTGAARITNRKYGGYDSKSYRGILEYPDNKSESVYQNEQVEFLLWAYKHLALNGTLVYNHKPRRKNMELIHPLFWIQRVPELVLMEDIIWNRGSTHNHCTKLMWPHTERIFVFRKINEKYNFKNTKKLQHRSDVWNIPKAKVNGHNAPFPVELVTSIVESWSEKGDTVMDPYMGSCTTGAVCVKLGRNFVGAEILPKYYKMATKNIEKAIHCD